jgi:hypothetical protein
MWGALVPGPLLVLTNGKSEIRNLAKFVEFSEANFGTYVAMKPRIYALAIYNGNKCFSYYFIL